MGSNIKPFQENLKKKIATTTIKQIRFTKHQWIGNISYRIHSMPYYWGSDEETRYKNGRNFNKKIITRLKMVIIELVSSSKWKTRGLLSCRLASWLKIISADPTEERVGWIWEQNVTNLENFRVKTAMDQMCVWGKGN